MDHDQLLNRISQRDMAAYHHLTEQYGWKLYSYLKPRFQDKEQLDAAFHETLCQFYDALAGREDVVEAMLFSFADHTCRNMLQGQAHSGPVASKKKSGGKAGTIFFAIAIGILLLGIFVSLWVIIGLLMDLGIMPEVDLGYSWFNQHVFPWF